MKSSRATTILSAMALTLSGCGGAKITAEAANRARSEQPSVEVCLDRLDDIQAIQGQLDDFLFRSPMSPGAQWTARLQQVPPDRALALYQIAASTRPYDRPGRQVPPIKILRFYNEEVLAEATAFVGEQLNVLAALDVVAPEGSKIHNKYEGVRANRVGIAEIEGRIEGLEAEAEFDETPERRRKAIGFEIESLKKQVEDLEMRNATVEEALYAEVDALEARGLLGPEVQPLASSLFLVFQHLARMEEESVITARLVSIQLVQVIPRLKEELQDIGQRLVADVAADLGGQAAAAQNARVSVSLDGGALRVDVAGLQTLDPTVVAQNLGTRLTSLKDQVMGAPTAIAIGGSVAGFEHEFFSRLAAALGASSGNVFAGGLSFSLPQAAAGAAGGFSTGAGGGFPPPGGQPVAPGGAEPWGPPPPQGPPGAQPGVPPGGQWGTPPVGGEPPVFPAQPPAAPPAAEPAPPPPPPPPPPAAPACPPTLCGGPIDGTGVGQIKLGMPGMDTARALNTRITPRTDADHPFPTADVAGVLISFCEDKVCRVEATVQPPATTHGFGVGSDFSKVAKKLGASMCKPIDKRRYAVEFEKLPGVYWLADKFDCEGVEDLDFINRTCKGRVTTVIVGIPK